MLDGLSFSFGVAVGVIVGWCIVFLVGRWQVREARLAQLKLHEETQKTLLAAQGRVRIEAPEGKP